MQVPLATRAKFAMTASTPPVVTLPAPAPAAAASAAKPPPAKVAQDKGSGSGKGASATLVKQPATSFSAAAYKDDFEEYKEEFEDDN